MHIGSPCNGAEGRSIETLRQCLAYPVANDRQVETKQATGVRVTAKKVERAKNSSKMGRPLKMAFPASAEVFRLSQKLLFSPETPVTRWLLSLAVERNKLRRAPSWCLVKWCGRGHKIHQTVQQQNNKSPTRLSCSLS